MVGGLVGNQRGHPHADPDLGVGLDGGADRVEAARGLGQVGPAQAAHELVSAVTDDRVERPEPGADLADHRLQHAIARGVAVAIVHALEFVDVDEGEDEPPVRPSCPVDLVRERQPTHLAPVRAGQLVQVGRPKLRLEPDPFPSGVRAIQRGALAVRGRPGPVGGSLGAHQFELSLL